MHFRIALISLAIVGFACQRANECIRNEVLFNDSWKFFLGDTKGAEATIFNDTTWRNIDLPHDWSIENLEGQQPNEVVGPFFKQSIGTTSTGYSVGGTAWYRKTFTLPANEKLSQTIINFDGVYMNSDVWVNGKFVGNHPYGYTAFHYDITDYLNPANTPNVIAVKVKNEGQNSRWYSGSGIYRNVHLIQKQATHIAHNGVCISTESISANGSEIKITTKLVHDIADAENISLSTKIINPDGVIEAAAEVPIKVLTLDDGGYSFNLKLSNSKLWSVEVPNLYSAEITVLKNGKPVDKTTEIFGIRTIHFDAKTGFSLNGKSVLLKGGCMHHANGFLGSATIARAEERRVELMKANGFNAIRCSHNPPSKAFLDACDRLGVLVIDEAFDQWERPKNKEDYNLYFKQWWKKDLESMVLRDRNHPSVIIWSIGNEINERADSLGYAIRDMIVPYVHQLDSTRPVTEAICAFWDHWGQDWKSTELSFAKLDVGGYNYLDTQYEADHEEFPDRLMVGTESYPAEAYSYWQQVEKNPYVIGDFVWTAMDYLGENACGNSAYAPTYGQRVGLKPWPWFNAFCGDIDLCGNKKPQSYYRDVVWGNSKLEMMVHAPIPEGMVETISYWGWPDELQSWNWKGNEGNVMDVRVFSSCPVIRLELNGKIIGEQSIGENAKLIANFKVPYEAGVLKAIALKNGDEVASKILKTTGEPAKIWLMADRKEISANRSDLSYVKVEITDEKGNLIPNAEVPVKFSVSGVGEIAGSGNGCPTDMESFNNLVCKTWQGKALVILRPEKENQHGNIILKAETEGLPVADIIVKIE